MFKKILFIFLLFYFILFFLINILNLKIGFIYDGAFVDSTESFNIIKSKNIPEDSEQFWYYLNNSFLNDRENQLARIISTLGKIIGFDIVLIIKRSEFGAENFKEYLRKKVDDFYFEKEIKDALLSDKFIFLFCANDNEIKYAKEYVLFAININKIGKK
ncbi:MAG TPA: hypothetical protein PLD27_10870 [bacterium]|nr:hypothetical protein [bacterium]HOL48124.1 hypothetical protein [bacterium]HPQ19729.1 hypothetical protein [bacterium]